jgi:putative DNA primase/helicase
MPSREYTELTPDDIWSMLGAIPAYQRGDWIKVGMVLKTHLGDTGFSLFDDWSQAADNYNASEARSVWRSFRGSGVGIGTLVHMAKQNGWRSDSPTTPAPAPAPRRAPKPQQSNTARYAAELWLAANKWIQADDWLSNPGPDVSVAAHPYAIAKDITHAGGAGRHQASGSIIGKRADCLIIPIREHGTGKMQAVECINPQGKKQTFGPKSGGYLLLGNTLDKSSPWYVCEGWASAYSMVWHWPNPDDSKPDNSVCAVSFGKANLDHCAEQIEAYHDPYEITIIRERD